MVEVQLLQPKMLLWAVPAIALIIHMIRKDFVKLPEDPAFQEKKKKWRRWITVSRVLIVILLAIALAQPYGEVTKETSGNPRITVLIDNSTSMELFDLGFTGEFLDRLEERIPLKVRSIGKGENSPLGEGIMANLEKGSNVLLISDGHNNQGTSLGDVSLFASNTNSTVSALDLTADKKDVGVSVLGPRKVVEDVNNTFLVRVTKPGVSSYHLTVTIDGETYLDVDTDKSVVRVQKSFTESGDHTIKAEVSTSDEDHFTNNNVFYKTLSVVQKPKVLYMTDKNTPLGSILNQLYDVDKRSTMPRNISDYYTVVSNDLPAQDFNRHYDKLSDYLIDGNGLVVFGGFNSYDRGGYKNSLFEQLLPVKVGNAQREFSDNTIVLAIDRSGGGGRCYYVPTGTSQEPRKVCQDVAPIDIIKSQAVEVIEQMDETNKIGAVAFDKGTYLIEPIESLYKHKQKLVEKIKKIQPGTDARISAGLGGAYNLLSKESGSRYVILLTDGLTYKGDQEESVSLAGNLYNQGIKVVTVGIGRNVLTDFLKSTASNGGGFYVSASNKGRLKVLFGDPTEDEKDDNYGLIPVNTGHFITQRAEPNAVMKGFNQVLPKSNAELLITTDTGEPALTVWRYGLGKVASWNVFSGNTLGDLLNKDNSELITRTVNWAVGDPERKKDYFVDIRDGRIGKPLTIEVKSGKIPSAEGLNFVKQDEQRYEASFTPNQTGVSKILDKQYAVNYPREYEETGFNQELQSIVTSTGGNLFKPSEIDKIVEFVKSVSTKTVTEKTTIVWPFLLGAIVIFLLEVLLRRISENKMFRER